MRDFPDILPLRLPRTSSKFKILEVKFGDGYSQRGAAGINNKEVSYQLTFQRPYEEISLIQEFLDEHRGAESFRWSLPNLPEASYICKGYQGPLEFVPGWFELKCTFNLVYDF